MSESVYKKSHVKQRNAFDVNRNKINTFYHGMVLLLDTISYEVQIKIYVKMNNNIIVGI